MGHRFSSSLMPHASHLALTGSLTALFVARALVPSDVSAGEGSDAVFVMLWLVLAVGWLVTYIRQPRLLFRASWMDVALLALVTAYVVSGMVAVETGSPRPAINALWQWIAVAVAYLLVRQLVASAIEIRALAAAMCGLALALAAMGLYEYFFEKPLTQARYERIKDDPDRMLAEVGQWYPPGSPERQRFENRLYSSEPTATFALTNSLAGYLAPWLIFVVGIGLVAWNRGAWLARSAAVAAVAIPIALCLLLTKSRSATIAAAGGFVLLWPACRMRELGAGGRKLFVGGVATAAALLFAVWMAGAVDREVFSEAGKSLGYRLQYWQATAAMIAQHPWLGCGPGQFQDYYTAFKLPAASEEVQDPHNFLLEVWATAGTPALLALLALLAMIGWQTWTAKDCWSEAQKLPPARAALTIAGGAVAGVFLAHLAGASVGFPLSTANLLIGVLGVAAGIGALYPWILSGMLPPRLLGLAVLVLLVNLLAAGGISYLGVSGSLWLLAALASNRCESRTWQFRVARHMTIIAAAAMGLVVVIAYTTLFRPVISVHALLDEANSSGILRDVNRREAILKAAVESDPRSVEAARLLAHHYLLRWEQNPTDSLLAEFQNATRRALLLAPQSSVGWGQAARWYVTLYGRTGGRQHLDAAIDAYRRAVKLYPNSSQWHAELATAFLAAGRREDARREARKALDLDDAIRRAGHEDRVLSDRLRTLLQSLDDRTLQSACDSDKRESTVLAQQSADVCFRLPRG